MIRKAFIIGSVASLIALGACNENPKTKSELNSKIDKELEVDDELVDDLNKAKQVFYALPSPIETAMLIKRAGTEFDENLLNSTENAKNYTTSRDKALNFGVYGADLSYCGLFSQTQAAIDYMAISKRLADELSILDFLEANFVERLEKNVNNRDSSMNIITDGFMNSNTYLKEAGRPEIATLIITGGWIEGLYIATSLAKSSPNNNELIDRIIDQKLSLATLISLLSSYENNADIDYILAMVENIKAVYDQIQIVTSKVEPVTNNESNITTLQAKTEIFISDEVFSNLLTTVDSIRNEITGI
ncbi:MAG: hypothetical protein PF517_21590 [Salinivirgaceae bacterium]|nr:hypothetical protein [Salinivirgaceae bacterium]